MWHIKLNNMDEDKFKAMKNLIGNKVYSKKIGTLKYKEYYFILDDKNIKSSPEALNKGKDEIKILTSTLNIYGYKNTIIADCPCEIHPDGTKTMYISFFDKVDMRSITDTLCINNELIYSAQKEKEKNIKDIYSQIIQSEIKKQLIVYMAEEPDWINAYKIYEILKAHFQCEKKLKTYPELSTFAHTANSPNAIGTGARHAIQPTSNPKKITDLETAYKKLTELSFEFFTGSTSPEVATHTKKETK